MRAPSAVIAPGASTVAAEPRLVAVDVFDTDSSSVERVLAMHGDALRDLLRDDVEVDLGALIADIRAGGGYAYVEPALVGYYEPDGMKYYLTIDLVSERDAVRRMSFLPAPDGTHEDPGGLLADWDTYHTRLFELMAAGEVSAQRVACSAFHCLGDAAHPALAELAAGFVERVPAHVEELAAVLRDDSDESRRAAAAFLLAYSTDGIALVGQLLPAMRDGSSLVRNNVMRVLAEIARDHPEIAVPLEPVLEALDYPATTDRNKASAILEGLLLRPGAEALYPRIVERAGTTLLAMLRLQQPNNHDFAYSILKAISGEDLGERDHAAWEAWLRAQQDATAR